MQNRRELLIAMGLTAAALGVGLVSARPDARESLLEAAGVRPGATFGTCSVLAVEPTANGAVALRMSGRDGRRFELELVAHDPATPGVAQAGSLSVHVNNGGRGRTATDEEHGLAAMALARHLAQREAQGARLPRLRTLSERASRVGANARA